MNKTSTPAVVIKSVNFSLITVTFQFWLTASWQGNYTCFWKGFVYILHGWFLSALLSHPSKQVHIITVTPKKKCLNKTAIEPAEPNTSEYYLIKNNVSKKKKLQKLQSLRQLFLLEAFGRLVSKRFHLRILITIQVINISKTCYLACACNRKGT